MSAPPVGTASGAARDVAVAAFGWHGRARRGRGRRWRGAVATCFFGAGGPENEERRGGFQQVCISKTLHEFSLTTEAGR